MESAGKRLRTRTDIGKDIERCLDDLKITHAELAEMLNVSDKTVDRMIGGKGPTTKYASALAKVTGKPESWFKENITWEECGKEDDDQMINEIINKGCRNPYFIKNSPRHRSL